MSTFDIDRLALVVATPEGGGAEEVATGYFLTGDLVLTVRHAGPRGSVFAVRCESGGTEEQSWSPATVVWEGTSGVDAMLLRTEKAFGTWASPDLKPDKRSGAWVSSGYARAAEDDGNRKTQPLRGEFDESRGQGAWELSLGTDRNIQDKWQEYWRGLSGGPIFCDTEEGGLVGVITDASRVYENELRGLPVARLVADIEFVSHVSPSFLGALPDAQFCAVLTREGGSWDLLDKVSDVIGGHPSTFDRAHKDPVHIDVLKAIASVANWAATVKTLAQADYVVADVTGFQPAIMLLLGVRSVLRRGVTVSVTQDDLSDASTLPFNVQETRVISFVDDLDFYEDLHDSMSEGFTNLAKDPNYLDLPAYHAVRVPRPESWAESDHQNILLLCPYGGGYPEVFRNKLDVVIRASTDSAVARRMLDLRSPRLVGQALYEQIRWASRCIVDWSHWRANVFFELGVRLTCSERDPLLIIDARDRHGPRGLEGVTTLHQYQSLIRLLGPVLYNPESPRDNPESPRAALKGPLERWTQSLTSPLDTPDGVKDVDSLPPAGTFQAAQTSFQWRLEAVLNPPHREQQRRAEWILGSDPAMRPERLILFAGNPTFDAELLAAVRENWIAAWLYSRHLASAEDPYRDDLWEDLEVLGPLVQDMLKSSREKRHQTLRADIARFLRTRRPHRSHSEGSPDHG
jgi:hypothetical protein